MHKRKGELLLASGTLRTLVIRNISSHPTSPARNTKNSSTLLTVTTSSLLFLTPRLLREYRVFMLLKLLRFNLTGLMWLCFQQCMQPNIIILPSAVFVLICSLFIQFCIVTRLWVGQPRNLSSAPFRSKELCCYPNYPEWFWGTLGLLHRYRGRWGKDYGAWSLLLMFIWSRD